MENIKVKITTIQIIDDAGNEDIIELVTEAVKSATDDCTIISYDESDISESEGTKTKLKIYKNKMIMTKVGNLSSRMEFEKNKKYSNLYSTPYGTFDLNFNTVIYENNLNEDGKGTVYIEYRVTLGGAEENYNKLQIDIY
ncbi:MAG: calycin [Sedimentibacter sp.]|nr:calycin [Sedimentibacter sp.]